MLALPAAPAPAPRRQFLAGTTFVAVAATMFFGGMLALWMRFRTAAPLKASADGVKQLKDWVPKGVEINDVAANLMLISLVGACVMAQLAVYAAKRGDRVNLGIGIGMTIVLGLATINAQAFEWNQMVLPLAGGVYNSMFYAITGAFVAVLIALLLFTLFAGLRYLGGRAADRQMISGLALCWYAATAIFAAVWFLVYVTK